MSLFQVLLLRLHRDRSKGGLLGANSRAKDERALGKLSSASLAQAAQEDLLTGLRC